MNSARWLLACFGLTCPAFADEATRSPPSPEPATQVDTSRVGSRDGDNDSARLKPGAEGPRTLAGSPGSLGPSGRSGNGRTQPFLPPTLLYVQHTERKAWIGFEIHQGYEVQTHRKHPLAGLLGVPAGPTEVVFSFGQSYSGTYDFAMSTQYSGPVLSLDQNPVLLFGAMHWKPVDTSIPRIVSWYGGISHQSNGMFLDDTGMYRRFNRMRPSGTDTILAQQFASMGWNYWWTRLSYWNGDQRSEKGLCHASLELREYLPQESFWGWGGPLEDTSSFLKEDSRYAKGYPRYDGIRLQLGYTSRKLCRSEKRLGVDLGFQTGYRIDKATDLLENGSYGLVLHWIWSGQNPNDEEPGFGLFAGMEHGHFNLARYWRPETRIRAGLVIPVQSLHRF